MDNMMIGLQGLVLGLGSVFLVLLILIIFIVVMGKVVQGSTKKKEAEAEQKVVEVSPKIEDDEDEVIAAITAAIACMAQREGKKFKIRSFKRV